MKVQVTITFVQWKLIQPNLRQPSPDWKFLWLNTSSVWWFSSPWSGPHYFWLVRVFSENSSKQFYHSEKFPGSNSAIISIGSKHDFCYFNPRLTEIQRASPDCIFYGLNHKFEKKIETPISSIMKIKLDDIMTNLLFAFCCEVPAKKMWNDSQQNHHLMG